VCAQCPTDDAPKPTLPAALVPLCAANERTFLHWMNMSVTTGSISAALLGEPSKPAIEP
jgi:hypothetical protein